MAFSLCSGHVLKMGGPQSHLCSQPASVFLLQYGELLPQAPRYLPKGSSSKPESALLLLSIPAFKEMAFMRRKMVPARHSWLCVFQGGDLPVQKRRKPFP